jgi:hypothetical protein
MAMSGVDMLSRKRGGAGAVAANLVVFGAPWSGWPPELLRGVRQPAASAL